MSLVPRPPDPVAFAPFGAFIDPPEEFGERAFFSDWLAPVPSRVQQCHVNRVVRTALPLSLNLVECHPHAAQVFIPMGEVSRYLVVVMPSSSAGGPALRHSSSQDRGVCLMLRARGILGSSLSM